jgi:hypothetical protein
MEFEYFMDKLWKLLHTRKFRKLLPRGTDYKLSFDGDGCHQGANLAQFDIKPTDIESHPSNSSDMHKVVENGHGTLQNHMQRWLLERERTRPNEKLKVAECQAQLEQRFYQMTTTGEIERNVLTLKDTYKAIIAAGGGYPPKRFRQ